LGRSRVREPKHESTSRTASIIRLKISLTTITILPEIEKLLGLDKKVFMNAIYVKQGEIAKLMDAKPSERKKLISEILGIEELEKFGSYERTIR